MPEVHKYSPSWPVYGLNWSNRPGSFRLGISSFITDLTNKIKIIQLSSNGELVQIAETEHDFPVTKLLWAPPKSGLAPDLLATTGEYFRIWELVNPDIGSDEDHPLICRASLGNSKKIGKQENCSPISSFDWNDFDSNMCITSSVNTTCTVWDLEVYLYLMKTLVPRTQLIAHDSEVYDISFTVGTHGFATVAKDGSLRMFDLRLMLTLMQIAGIFNNSI